MTETTNPAPTAERLLAGKQLRAELPRSAQAILPDRTGDALAILDEQNAARLPELVPLRIERMSANPFAFYRGSAAIMAHDLSAAPHTGILVPSCGDAHLANFGFYASPQRTLVFDLNDFDEAAWAPWEWDVKRLVASVVLSGLESSRDLYVIERAAVATVRSYAFALSGAVQLSPLDRFYHHLYAESDASALPGRTQRVIAKAVRGARKRTNERAARKLTEPDASGLLRFVPSPPTMVPVAPEIREQITDLYHRYLAAAGPAIGLLTRHYAVTDVIRRVVGVGSVGTRCALTLLQDGDGHALILQSKQASSSVLEQYGGVQQPEALTNLVGHRGHGARVVAMQQVLQAVSDPFLGSLQFDGIDLFVRQFHDMKGGFDSEDLDDTSFTVYARACGITLARAHSQSPNAAIISGYLGTGRRMGQALWQWGLDYAERTRADHAEFVARYR